MSTAIASARTTARRLPTTPAVLVAIVSAVVVGDLASTVIAVVARAAGVASGFRPLQFPTYTGLIVLGVVGGAIGWQVLRARASRPEVLLPRLVPAVLLVSFAPDILIGVTHGEGGATWGGVAALMCMHVVVAAAAVASYSLFLPVDTERR
jgi:hypothetical protein